MISHSEKGLETIRQMNTLPEQWALTPIKWVEETRMVMVEDTCPTCRGHRSVLYNEAGAMLPVPEWPKSPTWIEGQEDNEENNKEWELAWERYRAEQARHNHHMAEIKRLHGGYAAPGNCPSCIRKRGWRTGKALVPAPRKVMVGYPQWLPGIRFDSRFEQNNVTGRYCCGLCSKTIKESNLVPVQATGADGQAHGMWIGCDCAMKIFRAELKKKKDFFLDRELSVTL